MKNITNKIVLEMQKSAKTKKLHFTFLQGPLFIVSRKNKSILFSETTPETTSSPIGSISNNKFITNLFLKMGDFNVLPSQIINTTQDAINFIDHNGPAVIKPLHGIHGKGVSVNVSSDSNIKSFIKIAQDNDKSSQKNVLIENFCDGIEYRILTIGQKVFVTKKEPAYIITDGVNTIQDQITQLDHLPGFRVQIEIDDNVNNLLKEQDFTLSDIPEKGHHIDIKKIANFKSGALVTGLAHPIDKKFTDIGVTIARYLQTNVIGIDVIIDHQDEMYILEINIDPGIQLHMNPTFGTPYNVCDEILDYFFSKNSTITN